jgi:phage terminase small subunit
VGVGNKIGKLTRRQALFVAAVLKGTPGTQAAIEAGYSRKCAGDAANRLTNEVPAVREALKAGQELVRAEAQVTAVTMIHQADEDRQFAMENRNPMAAVKSSELKAKLAGLLIDKIESKSMGVVINVQKFGDHD